MEYRNVGRSGLQVSSPGSAATTSGCGSTRSRRPPSSTARSSSASTLFDTADIYGGTRSEEFLGAALGDRRKNVVVATKFVGPAGEGPLYKGASRAPRLPTPSRTACGGWGPTGSTSTRSTSRTSTTPIEETLRALDDLVRQGKVRYYRLLELRGLAGRRGAVDHARRSTSRR